MRNINSLYREVEDLRRELYLDHFSPLYQAYRTGKEIGDDIMRVFGKKTHKKTDYTHLLRQKKMLNSLARTPYGVFCRFLQSSRFHFPWLRSEPTTTPSDHSFVMFGSAPFEQRHKRSVQIARALAKKYQVIYIEPVFTLAKKPGYNITHGMAGITLVRLHSKRRINIQFEKSNQVDRHFLRRSLGHVTRDLYPSRRHITYIHHPFWLPILQKTKNDIIVYDSQDLMVPKKRLNKKIDLLTGPTRGMPIVIPNGVVFDDFKEASRTRETCDVGLCWIKRPVIGYIGALNERVDAELIGKIAHSNPTASVVLVGNINYRPVIAVAEQHPNIFPVGEQKYERLSLYLQSFDILVVPYRSAFDARTQFPEIGLYLASGKPIVVSQPSATPGGAKRAAHLFYYARTPSEWNTQIQEALREKKRSRKKYLRIKMAQKMRWNIAPLMKVLRSRKIPLHA